MRISKRKYEALKDERDELARQVKSKTSLVDALRSQLQLHWDHQDELQQAIDRIDALGKEFERLRVMYSDEVQKRFELAEMLAKVMDFEDDEDGN